MSKEVKNTLLLQGSILAAAGIFTKLIGFLYRIPMANLLGNQGNGVYMGYPLMITNLAIAALNLAAGIGEKQVTADVVRMVR